MNGDLPKVNNETRGLSSAQVAALQKHYGKNIIKPRGYSHFLLTIIDIIKEPMFILLVIACTLYFILGNTAEGIMMGVAILLVSAISVFQETRSANALKALKQYMEPKVKLIRDGLEVYINSSELVPGDLMLLEEGMRIPADGIVLASNDLSTDDSVITGESMPVDKNNAELSNFLYQGTTINSGKCMAKVTATGIRTKLGMIGKSIGEYSTARTALQMQVNRFVKQFALFGFAGFIIILFINYARYQEFTTSLLFALTVAMSVIPEEIPVAFSSFMALGAYKMGKLGIIARQPQVIENLGRMNILCLDKTGTLTENKMQLQKIYAFEKDKVLDMEEVPPNSNLLKYAWLASEHEPFDAMEKAIAAAFEKNNSMGDPRPKMIHEYPLEGKPPMMTHIFQKEQEKMVAGKGAVERIMEVAHLQAGEREKVFSVAIQLSSKGYRVLGVARANFKSNNFPPSQNDFEWQFLGLLALYDPPKKNAATALKKIYDAGITIKLVTGDYPETAMNIAEQCGLQLTGQHYTGDQVMSMNEEELTRVATEASIFARMFPEAKLKLINSLKVRRNIVGMTGDGVNDGPALKSADIGIAMGKKGTETARQAADLVLADDNLENIMVSIGEGRRIFSNLVKAIRYIISIHIPIIMTASIPLILGWSYPNIFTPVHVIFMELIMTPTCSIFYENEPVEKSVLGSSPRGRKAGLFSNPELILTIIQGMVLSAGVLLLYHFFMKKNYAIEETRMIVFTTLVAGNIFLTFVNRSFTQTIFQTIRYKNKLALPVFFASVLFLGCLHFFPAVQDLFKLRPLTAAEFFLCIGVAAVSVGWFELYKAFRSYIPRN